MGLIVAIKLEEYLRKTAKNKEAISFFKDLFITMHLIITDKKGEAFTINSDGKKLKILKGLKGDPTMKVAVPSEKIKRLWEDFRHGKPDKAARQRIAQTLFASAIQSIYESPDFKSIVIENISHINEFIHFSLIDDMGKEFAETTVINKYDQWIVIPGFWGDAPLKAQMTINQAIKAYSLILKIAKAGFKEKMELMQEFKKLMILTRKKYEIV